MSGDGERGRFIGKPSVLNSTTPGLEDALRKKIFAGVDGSTVEQGLAAMKEALSPAKLADENQGFFRNDALLAIIVLSNEDDSSVGKVEDYTKFLDELKEPIGPDDRGWILNYLGVLGTPLENCKTFGQYVDPGYRYIDVSDYSKGSSSTICTTSLKQAVNNLEKIILELVTQIVLERIPRKETIEVFMDGLRVEEDPVNGWTYNEQGNSVQFHGSSIPHSDTDIRIIFQPMTAK